MSTPNMKHFCMRHLLPLTILINIVHPYYEEIQTAKLSPSQTFSNGVRMMSNINEVIPNNDIWNVNIQYQNSWQFIVSIDNSFGFNSFTPSSISISIDIPTSNTQDLLFGFTGDNQQYISLSIPLDNTGRANKIFPSCNPQPITPAATTPFGIGDIAAIPTFNRICDIAGNSCQHWQNMMPPNNFFTPKSPITFTLENDPINNQLILFFKSQSIYNTEIIQMCVFNSNTNFISNNGLKLYVAGAVPGETYSIQSFDITSHLKIPTTSPTKAPSNNPTISPTKKPTKSPTFNPTTNPTKSPTKSPSNFPTYNPSENPSNFPSITPSQSPSNMPSVSPTLKPTNNPTNNPTNFPTKKPTQNPTHIPTMVTATPVTARPTNNPSFIPTNIPSVAPSKSPLTISPTNKPTPVGFKWGYFGQLCGISIENQCGVSSMLLADINGNINCNQWECCMCEMIECGFNNGIACNQLLVVGDYGMYGVKNVRIAGNSDVGADGVSVACQGIESCKETTIYAENVNLIDCDGDNACQMAVMMITNPKNGFTLECNGKGACEELEIDIILSEPTSGYQCNPNIAKQIFQFSKIACNNNNACKGLTITIKNEGCDSLIIQDLECIQPNSCNNAVFNLIGDITIDNCLCGPTCNTVTGLGQCFSNLENYICSDPNSCATQSKTIENPRNGFEFKCSAFEACINSNFIIQLNNNPSKLENIDYIPGFLLDGEYSAAGTTFTIDNKQGVILTIGRIQCSGTNACQGTTFIIGADVTIEEVICAPGACLNCEIKQNINSPGIPCDPTQISSVLKI